MRRISGVLGHLHPDHFRIARAGLWLLIFTTVAKLFGAAKEIAIAWRFGLGPEVDAYNLALTLSTWLPVTLYSVAGVVLVPALVRIGRDLSQQQAFLRELNGATVLSGAALAAVTWVAASPVVDFFTATFPAATREMTVAMLRSFAPLALLTVVIGVIATRLQAVHDHRYALAEGVPALAIILLLLIWQTADAMPLVAGTLVGFAAQAWWLYYRARGIGTAPRIALGFRSEHWRGLWRAALVIGAGQLAMSFTVPIDQWFAARVGPGALATLGYANRVIALGMTLGATVISRATLPIFAEGIAGGSGQRVRRHALRWASLMLLAGAVGAAILWLAAEELVGLLFERGAFSRKDTWAVASALRWGVFQLPPYLAGLVLVSLLAAQRRYEVIAAIAAVNLLSKTTWNLLFMEQFGLNGVLFSSVVMYALSTILCWVAVLRSVNGNQESAE